VRQLDVAVARSTVTTVVVYFSIVLTWILITSVVGMTFAVAIRGRRVEIRMIACFGMLLFAMTAFRNSLPRAPPMGTFSDYLAFFWGYAVAIIAIVVLAGGRCARWAPRNPNPCPRMGVAGACRDRMGQRRRSASARPHHRLGIGGPGRHQGERRHVAAGERLGVSDAMWGTAATSPDGPTTYLLDTGTDSVTACALRVVVGSGGAAAPARQADLPAPQSQPRAPGSDGRPAS
jgi:hypothetical protein